MDDEPIDDAIYLDKNWKIVDKEDAAFKKIFFIDKDGNSGTRISEIMPKFYPS